MSIELDRDHAEPRDVADGGTGATPPSRAAEVLEQMVRDPGVRQRPWRWPRDRSGPPEEPRRAGGGPGGRAAQIVAAATVALLLVALLVAWRRPAPIEDRLPIATAADVVDTTPPDTASAGSGSTSTAVPTELVVHVAGAVAAPGVVHLGSGSRVVDAVSAAGGLRADADPDRVNLAAPLVDGQRVVVPILGQPVPAEVAGGQGPADTSGGAPVADGSTSGPVDLNSATAEQLDRLPGVGPATAAAIISHRESDGPFGTVDDLLDVRGIGEAKLEALRDLVTTGAAP